MSNTPGDSEQDEVIFSARYSAGKVILILVIYCLFIYLFRGVAYDIARDIYEGIVVRNQGLIHFLLLALIQAFVLLSLLPLALNPIGFKEIIFYPNRVQIRRRIFWSKTIYYARATVESGTLLPGYLIEEVSQNGQPPPTRLLYDFTLFFFPSDAARKIEKILDYLTDDLSRKNPRIFKRSVLPRLAANHIIG